MPARNRDWFRLQGHHFQQEALSSHFKEEADASMRRLPNDVSMRPAMPSALATVTLSLLSLPKL
jgi:hypothetical protein